MKYFQQLERMAESIASDRGSEEIEERDYAEARILIAQEKNSKSGDSSG